VGEFKLNFLFLREIETCFISLSNQQTQPSKFCSFFWGGVGGGKFTRQLTMSYLCNVTRIMKPQKPPPPFPRTSVQPVSQVCT